MKRVRCVDNSGGNRNFITIGQVYKVKFEGVFAASEYEPVEQPYYRLEGQGHTPFFAKRFVVISCPCDVKGCLKHRDQNNKA